jgi:hypothetical protein
VESWINVKTSALKRAARPRVAILIADSTAVFLRAFLFYEKQNNI